MPEPANRDDEVAARFLATGSEAAFAALFRVLLGRLTRFFAVRGLALVDAEECAQEVLLTVYRRSGDVREPKAFYGWVFRIARHELCQRLRGGREEGALEDLLPNGPLDPFDTESAILSGYYVEQWLSHLDPQTRQIMMLRFIDELTYEEIAVALDMPAGTVKWKVSDAKLRLARFSRRKATQP